MSNKTGAALIAKSLHQLGIKVIFGLVGIPVIQIAEECIALGIHFIAFRNEQAASYAATAYGYLTGKPGVCLVVGGPGVLHAMAGVGNSSANSFPLLLLAGSSETHLVRKGAFQELDAVALLAPHVKLAVRSRSDSIGVSLKDAYRTAWFGRPGTGFVDIPADVIQEEGEDHGTESVSAPPKSGADPARIEAITKLIKSAKAPLIILGKGAAYAQAEEVIRTLIDKTQIPFLPTPMGKGIVSDSHPLNTSSARSTALKEADVVIILGARLNWILHYGESPKWNPSAKIIQVDISAEELGRNVADPSLSLLGDMNIIVSQLLTSLSTWCYNSSISAYTQSLRSSAAKNEKKAAIAAQNSKLPMSYAHAFTTIKSVLNTLSPPEDGRTVYISEGANTMDISRSIFPVHHPRLRLDAGTHATMGVGLGYAIAAHAAYNLPSAEGKSGAAGRKKIVCIEGDSAFGFSALEVETMARYGMDVLTFVMNNGGVYHGDSDTAEDWRNLQSNTISPPNSTWTESQPNAEAVGIMRPDNESASKQPNAEGVGIMRDDSEPEPKTQQQKKKLRSTSLGYEIGYEKIAEMCGGKGYLVRTPEELKKATEEGFKAGIPVVVNVMIESGKGEKLEFAWNKSTKKKSNGEAKL